MLILVAAINANAGQDNSYSTLLAPVLGHLDYALELHLRNPNDFNNILVRTLLGQKVLPLKVGINQLVSESDSILHHFFIYEDVRKLKENLEDFVQLEGFYLLALERSVDDEQQLLLQFMETIWQRHGHSRIYYIQQEAREVLLYNPFTQSIVLVKDSLSYQRIYSNLHGYALRAYIFDSVYSSLYGDGATKQVTKVTGPDAKVADTVAKHLNLTLNYIWPDDEFFG